MTAISGNVNLDVNSSAGFAIGDTVLIIQMKGATINQADASTFGDITAMGTAGKFEFATICGITGNSIQLQDILLNSFAVGAGNLTQMVLVPRYQDANVTATLTGAAWNGTTGGVIVFWVRGSLRLSAPISANSLGFRGGALQDIVSACSCLNAATLYTSYLYPSADWRGALKGEGIRELSVGTEAGKGKQATGGGGGNDHNTGGGGGSNYGDGGSGGNTQNSTCFPATNFCRGTNPGIGGLALSSTWYSVPESRVFLGGGGGAGHYANGTLGSGTLPGGFGGLGGGIVIIVADSINGNGNTISADGQTIPYTATADGGGGGGGGGSILIKSRAFSALALTLNARGGNGANHNWPASASNCKGPGGGGGGGVIWHSGASLPGSVSVSTIAGLKGTRSGASCNLSVNGETDGIAGATLNSLVIPQSIAGGGCGPLPIYLISFKAEQNRNEIQLKWEIANGYSGGTFDILRSADGYEYNFAGTINSSNTNYYSFTDLHPLKNHSRYKLRVRDADGKTYYSYSIEANYSATSFEVRNIYPNPVFGPHLLTTEFSLDQAGYIQFFIVDLLGKTILHKEQFFESGENKFEMDTHNFSAGTYLMRVFDGKRVEMRRIIVTGN